MRYEKCHVIISYYIYISVFHQRENVQIFKCIWFSRLSAIKHYFPFSFNYCIFVYYGSKFACPWIDKASNQKLKQFFFIGYIRSFHCSCLSYFQCLHIVTFSFGSCSCTMYNVCCVFVMGHWRELVHFTRSHLHIVALSETASMVLPSRVNEICRIGV